MKLELTATPDEIKEKSKELLKTLGELLDPVASEISDILEKAIPRKEQELKYPVLRELQKQTTALYEKQLNLMLSDIGKVLDRGLKKAEDISDPIGLPPKMESHFRDRTQKHISLVQKYCKLIDKSAPEIKGITERGQTHDDSKYGAAELLPYIWLTWRYKCKDDGVECKLPEGMEGKIDRATEHHILSNSHHPEFHQDKKEGLLNKEDRDKPPTKMVDATKMPDLDVAEMVADWCGMSEERGNTPREWADKNVNIRWKFTPKQTTLINKLIDSVWGEVQKAENTEPLQDFTKPIADKDEKKYEQVKAELVQYGYEDSDFEEGGILYGWSTNSLIDLAKAKKEQEKDK